MSFACNAELLFGGLPKNIGSAAILEHWRALEALGNIVADRGDEAVQRTAKELTDGLDEQARALESIVETLGRVDLATRLKTRAASRERVWAKWLDEHMNGTWVSLKEDADLVFDVDWDSALASFAEWLSEDSSRTLAEAVMERPRWLSLDKWDADSLLEQPLLSDLKAIDPWAVFLGLHELNRIPWTAWGGLAAPRLVSDEYLEALLRLNREVIHSHFILGWLGVHLEIGSELTKALEEIIPITPSFVLPKPVENSLQLCVDQYITGSSVMVLVAARAALEAAISWVLVGRGERPGSLYQDIERCAEIGALTEEGRRRATAIRLRGNKAVHGEMGTIIRRNVALDTISVLIDVLHELQDDLNQGDGLPENW